MSTVTILPSAPATSRALSELISVPTSLGFGPDSLPPSRVMSPKSGPFDPGIFGWLGSILGPRFPRPRPGSRHRDPSHTEGGPIGDFRLTTLARNCGSNPVPLSILYPWTDGMPPTRALRRPPIHARSRRRPPGRRDASQSSVRASCLSDLLLIESTPASGPVTKDPPNKSPDKDL